MKMYGKAENVASKIMEAFRSGSIPGALAQVFIHRKDDMPCRRWSFGNQVMTIFAGTSDARGFRQWEKAGRKVKKGAKSFPILAPCIGKDKTGEKEETFLYGFKSIPVFRVEDTEIFNAEKWAENSGIDQEAESWLKDLPLREVADHWQLNVGSYNGRNMRSLGSYSHGKAIAIGTENLSTWAHELVHAADDKNGTLTKKHGQDEGNETVAEFGGAILLKILGMDKEADLGGCLDYIQSYAQGDKGKALSRCMSLIKRTCGAVALILDTAEEIKAQSVAA